MLHENKYFQLFFPIFLMVAMVTIFSGCASTQVKDPKECCSKLSLHNQEMGKFTFGGRRYLVIPTNTLVKSSSV